MRIGRPAIGRLMDLVVVGAIIGLLAFGAFTGGAVETRNLVAAEVGVFSLAVLWAGRLRLVGVASPPNQLQKKLAILGAAFLVFCAFQLLPLPPAVIHRLSPETYRLYMKGLPGWPERLPYGWLSGGKLANYTGSAAFHNWRPLSIAPLYTQIGLLRFTSYYCLFFLVLLYPYGVGVESEYLSEENFSRSLLIASVGIAFILSLVALAKWSVAATTTATAQSVVRASGPFVNADHFAIFLAMILPVSISFASANTELTMGSYSTPARALAAGAAIFIVLAVLLSGSRSGWLGAALGVWLALGSSSSRPAADSSPSFLPFFSALPRRAVAALVLAVLLLLFLGERGRMNLGHRLSETRATEASFSERLGAWKDTIPMLRDFPLVGVGLGCWSEIFPHYQSPPWYGIEYWGQTHNDYLELLSETGVVGTGLLGGFILLVVMQIFSRRSSLSMRGRPVRIGLGAVIAVVALEECFDFGLQIPSNGFLFTVLAALAVRNIEPNWGNEAQKAVPSRLSNSHLLVATAASALAITATLRQSYPGQPATLSQAVAQIQADPANIDGHISLLELRDNAFSPSDLRREIQAAIWVEPTNPYMRDLYARTLIRDGNRAAAMAELRKSVEFSPDPSAHSFWVGLKSLTSLPADEREAIESGLIHANTLGYEGAAGWLADIYDKLGRTQDEAQVLSLAASREEDKSARDRKLQRAAEIYAETGELSRAETLLRRVIGDDPENTNAYVSLINDVLGPQGKFDSANALIAEVRTKSIDPYPLYLALASSYETEGNLAGAESVLSIGLASRPYDLDANLNLARCLIEEKKFNAAQKLLQKTTQLDSSSAKAFEYLAVAEEADYQYASAERHYARAFRLAPQDNGIKSQYESLKHKIEESGAR
jgi:O-antigen ligase/predicted negative regulator of RcsB-dependent stress response